MDIFTRQDLRQLIDEHQTPCVSVYLPTHRTGRETRQDPIRMKNLLDEAGEQLRALDVRHGTIQKVVRPAQELIDDSKFWENQSDGLAVFSSPDWFRRYRVPVAFDETTVVTDRFHVKPLLPLIQGEAHFYLLAVSQNDVRLFEGTQFTVQQLHPEHLPDSLSDALRVDEYQPALQLHSHHQFGGGADRAPEAMFHGQGSAREDKKQDELMQYFHRLNSGLEEFFHEEDVPLVFAGVDFLFPMFKEACSYRNLVDEPVRGNPDEADAKTLHQEAWRIIDSRQQQARRQALEEFGDRKSQGLASAELEDVLAASRQARVDKLFVAQGRDCWGKLDASSDEVTRYDEHQPGSEDLVDRATVETLRHGGRVYVVEPGQLPAGDFAAATYRFPVESGSEA